MISEVIFLNKRDENTIALMREAYAECGEHCQRVADLVDDFCRYLNLDDNARNTIYTAALFHDIGKLSVPETICKKPSSLTSAEWKYMKAHVVFSADFLKHLGYSKEICDIVRHHHERWDGKGYSDGERDNEIPFGSRIIAICDSYDAMRSSRCYHDPLTEERAMDEIKKNAGKMYDPALVEKFLKFKHAN